MQFLKASKCFCFVIPPRSRIKRTPGKQQSSSEQEVVIMESRAIIKRRPLGAKQIKHGKRKRKKNVIIAGRKGNDNTSEAKP